MLGYKEDKMICRLSQGYRVEKTKGLGCQMLLKDSNGKKICFLEVCNNKLSMIKKRKGQELTSFEKTQIYRFIMANQYTISNETANTLELSILRYKDGTEKYLSERQLKNTIKQSLDNVKIYVGKLKAHTLKIPAYTKGCIYNFSRAEINTLIIEENCDMHIDMRDNKFIEALKIRKNFSGSVNMSRNSVQSIEIEDNCRCDLSMFDSLKCFNLIIGDVYSGILNIKNSCFHALSVGYYCYAQIKLNNNWGRRDLIIGDSFRGELDIEGINIYNIDIGKDCKGRISIQAENLSIPHNINIAEDFGGSLDLQEDKAVNNIKVGRNASGKFNFWGCQSIKNVTFDKYFKGYADFSESSVEYVQAKYGSSGEMIFTGCKNLSLIRVPHNKKSVLTMEKNPESVENKKEEDIYYFKSSNKEKRYKIPFYTRLAEGISELWG